MSQLQNVNVPPPQHVMVLGGQGWIGLVDSMGTETSIVNAARVSFGKMREEMDERDSKLLEYLIKHQHTSPLEHVTFTFLVHCPLFVRSQWHRHRTWSYNEISRRYTQEDLSFYVPPEIHAQAESDRQASVVAPEAMNQDALKAAIDSANKAALKVYDDLLAAGVCREQARGVLPQNLMTTFWATVDLGNLLKFIQLRSSEHAQWEIRQYSEAIQQLLRPLFPHVAKIMNW